MTDRPAPDLPLFNWQAPKRVLVFPATRWTGKARHVAAKYASQRSEKARLSYWKRTIDALMARLIDAGADEEDARQQGALFCAAVQRELDLLNSQERTGA